MHDIFLVLPLLMRQPNCTLLIVKNKMKESQNIEFKESWRDEYIKWICGFANASGGKLYIGINDKGEVSGVPDSKKLLEEIPNKV